MKIKQITAFVLCVLLSLLTVSTASANSAQKYWHGIDANGAMVSDTDCPIIVENELLTFNIPDFPAIHGTNDNYSANVTAQYTFYNPADYTVTAKLDFPFGKSPDYSKGGDDTNKYDITVNGSAVEKTVRHTLPDSDHSFNLEKDLPRIVDEYKKDSFYRPNLPVVKYTVEILGYDKSYKDVGIGFDFSLHNSRVLINYNYNSGPRVGVHIGSKEYITFYILGEQEFPEYRFYANGGYETGETVSGEAKLVSAEEMTFEEFAFKDYPEDSTVLKADWYNAVVDELKSYYTGVIHKTDFNLSYSLMRWYEYEITLAPKERIVNTVTAPMYPDIDEDYVPDIYTYTYLLSPAQSWAEFGTLDIVLNTSFYLIKNDTFEKTDDGYKLSLNGLPDGELEFTLSSSEKPRVSIYSTQIFWNIVVLLIFLIPIFIIALIIVVITGIAAAVKRKR